jgi:hypothetical protein
MSDVLTAPSTFQEVLRDRGANSPEAWSSLANLLDRFESIVKGDLLPNLRNTVRAAEEASAILFCTIMASKRKNIELNFKRLVDQANGKYFGTRLINWAISKMDSDIAEDLKVAWSSQHQHMSSTIEMLILELEPVGANLSVEQVVQWIRDRGGIGKLNFQFMNYCQVEAKKEAALKRQREMDRERGALERRLIAAQAAGFETIEEHDAHLVKEAERQRVAGLRSKFAQIKEQLVTNGQVTTEPVDEQLLISLNGKLYVISDQDEFSLLSCAASIL